MLCFDDHSSYEDLNGGAGCFDRFVLLFRVYAVYISTSLFPYSYPTSLQYSSFILILLIHLKVLLLLCMLVSYMFAYV